MRLIFPDRGTARIFGCDISDITTHGRIGYLPENPYFYDYLTPRELLSYFGSLFGIDGRTAALRSEELLERVGILGKDRSRQLRKFSKGMLQRVGLAQALINDPELVILDEPMSGLDPIGRREVRELIDSLRTEGKTVFMSTHILADVEAICDEVAILSNGRLSAAGRLEELLSEGIENQFDISLLATDGLAQLLENFTEKENAVARGGVVTARVTGEKRLEQIIAFANSRQLKIASIQTVRKSLEELFVRKV
jgi:ABC-2 type transport system ATP-binding protein